MAPYSSAAWLVANTEGCCVFVGVLPGAGLSNLLQKGVDVVLVTRQTAQGCLVRTFVREGVDTLVAGCCLTMNDVALLGNSLAHERWCA